MVQATGVCTGNEVRIKLNKQMKCASIAADGSDFSISGGAAQVVAAESVACSNAFSTDTIALTLNQPLPAGDYTVNVKTGSDGNSLLDDCDNNMPDNAVNFTVHQNVSALGICEHNKKEFVVCACKPVRPLVTFLRLNNVSCKFSLCYRSTHK